MIHATRDSVAAARTLQALDAKRVVPRIWDGDHTVWNPKPAEIANRLGWLHAPRSMRTHVSSLGVFAERVRDEGCDAIALLGMGGSSLAPETLAAVCAPGHAPRLVVLDTTHPDPVGRALQELDPARTLYIVSTKSGTTTETLTLCDVFYQAAVARLGAAAGHRFVAITDPGSPLVELAQRRRFREVFLNDPSFGGRYAALSLVGLVPAALLGIDLDELLDSAEAMAARCAAGVPVGENPAALLAALLAAHADEGRDKATFLLQPEFARFGDWLEQLIAESTGKRGKGVLPVVGELPASADSYGSDRLFVRIGDAVNAPPPAIAVDAAGPGDLGGQFFLWEMATALLGHVFGVNPFDQPDVESAKQEARRVLVAEDAGAGEEAVAEFSDDAAFAFCRGASPPGYIALLPYLDPRSRRFGRLGALRRALRDATRCATTLGVGPRYLHSTGQLHKGDAGNGVFLILIDEPRADVEIAGPGGRPMGLRRLIHAQATGDARALAARGRRVVLLRVVDEGVADLRAPACRTP